MDFLELPFFDPDTDEMIIVEVSAELRRETHYWETGRHSTVEFDYTLESVITEDGEHISLPDWIDSRMIEEAIEDCIP